MNVTVLAPSQQEVHINSCHLYQYVKKKFPLFQRHLEFIKPIFYQAISTGDFVYTKSSLLITHQWYCTDHYLLISITHLSLPCDCP